ncbi:MAG: hypothetical protein J5507_07095 [Clostridia bacterium]|nr:hypothetical protein [Clostridia bacterium]
MAYMGRGGVSSFGGGLGGGRGSDNNDNRHNGRMYYRGGLFRMYYYIPLDNTYVIFQMISAIIIFAIAGITFLATYKPSVIDPLEETKRLIMNTYIIIAFTLVTIILLANYFSKDKNTLIKRLIAILLAAIVTILVFIGIKVNLNSTYTENKFEQIYIQENGEKTTDKKSKFNVGLTGVQMKTEKEYYIDECIKAYNIFSIRMYVLVGVNVLIIILLIYQIFKVSKIQDKRDRLSKDDAILFDEEENVKF